MTDILPVTPAAEVQPVVAAAPLAAPAEPQLILGKFKTQTDLETAYKNLEQAFHARTKPADPATADLKIPPPEPVTAAVVPPSEGIINNLLARAKLDGATIEQSFLANGKLTDAEYGALAAAGADPASVNGYLRGRAAEYAVVKQTQDQVRTRASEIAGGPIQLDNLLKWTGTPQSGFSPAQIADIQGRLNSPELFEGAMQQIKMTYAAKNGSLAESPMFTAAAAVASGSTAPFMTKHEATQARKEAATRYGEGKWHMDSGFMARLMATEKASPNLLKI